VITGGNGVGKSNVYRAIELLHAAAHGRLAQALAREGGLSSVQWAGPEEVRSGAARRAGRKIEGTRRKRDVRVHFGIQLPFASYEMALGVTTDTENTSAFVLDPDVKEEWLWLEPRRRPSNTWMTRDGPAARCLDREREWRTYAALDNRDTVLAQVDEPMLLPELHAMRATLRAFRFYHGFRTDPESPLRAPQIGVRTSVMASSGDDLAAALQTILEIGDRDALCTSVRDGLGAELDIACNPFEVGLIVPGLLRRLGARELSDGSLKYLALLAALCSPRPAPLLVFNEPEASLHPKLLAPLAKSFHHAAKSSQVWVISHASALVAEIEALGATKRIELERDEDGATRVVGQGMLDRPVWP
jgi:predicted ATPase